MFDALLIEKNGEGQTASVRRISDAMLPEGDVLIDVEWSTINYKDALAITGKGPVVRSFPMVPGVDLAGKVIGSESGQFRPGDRVLLNGWGVGEKHWGGLARHARVRSAWLTSVPSAFTTREAMSLGTAGYTAMLCVIALENANVTPDKGPVLVTGASGGVGSIAVMLLGRLGYTVVAMTGRPAETDYLKSLGADEIIDRELFTHKGKPLEKAQWAGAVDVAGGQVLASLCAAILPLGAVAACGLAGGMDLPLTVAPFILRGISLLGIDSTSCPQAERQEAWRRLADLIDPKELDSVVSECLLSDAVAAANDLLAGKMHGRVIVRMQ
ncbi:acrylyl-CoA reductase (NADPH) [Acetobacter oeni]|uniref:Alcohol dehydrogenase n=1 Tax=Acetobacter oeni TaxID=304077 RepID=A0A511XML6_9PROT|nr:MDR family oxidoreductase [Acetobacter oeni]MBB3881998.1 acrylyl-CoA reductase (NADPH) [Acetobacter oeni]NHO17684.1 acryloyl-CoA reductase [Acetobacter oeni]GBR00315.1 alcohol dehydrogenase [Acetobacter oeni LMG 21952]GEN64178.1 alcohol dehydrogenase [Acetobacter oeni]